MKVRSEPVLRDEVPAITGRYLSANR